MRTLKASTLAIVGTMLIVAAIVLTGCEKKIVNSSRNATVSMSARISSAEGLQAVDRAVLVVTASDMDPVMTELQIIGNQVIGEITIPAGPRRQFTLELIDSRTSTVVYYGVEVLDISTTADIEIVINLYPAQPMVNIAPHFQSVVMNDTFYLDIKAHLIPGLTEITFDLLNVAGPFWFDYYDSTSVVKGDGLPLETGMWFEGSVSNKVTISVYYTGQDIIGSLTDENGYAHLARVRYLSYADWGSDTALSVFSVNITSASTLLGPISPASIYTDQAEVELYVDTSVQVNGWEATAGGTGEDQANGVVQVSDGSCLAVGQTLSFGAGGWDVYLIKVDNEGTILTEKTFGSSGSDGGTAIAATTDGGSIITGWFTGGDTGEDVYLIKTDNQGNAVWQKTYGGLGKDRGQGVMQTPDGGYAIVGYTYAVGAADGDLYIIKTDDTGFVQWQKTVGEAAIDERGTSIAGTTDGGYIVAGQSTSAVAAQYDICLCRLDTAGTVLWKKTYGGSLLEQAGSVLQTPDGGFLIAGYTFSYGAGYSDMYVIKTDAEGIAKWEKTYGGMLSDFGTDAVVNPSGGYIITGHTASTGHGNTDAYVVTIDASGTVVNQAAYGGPGNDVAQAIALLEPVGYIIAGYTDSFGAGGNDVYLVRVR